MRQTCAYSIIRYVPNVAREEFVNVGILLVCPGNHDLRIRTVETFGELRKVFTSADANFVRHQMTEFRHYLEDPNRRDVFALLGSRLKDEELYSRSLLERFQAGFRNNVQFGPIRQVVGQPALLIDQLFKSFVSFVPAPAEPKGVTRQRMKSEFRERLQQARLFGPDKVRQDQDVPIGITKVKVDFAYRNEVMHYFQAMPLDSAKNTNNVMAYRMLKRDVVTKATDPAIKEANLIALYYASYMGREEHALLDTLKGDGIQTVNFMDTEEILKDIRRDLTEHEIFSA